MQFLRRVRQAIPVQKGGSDDNHSKRVGLRVPGSARGRLELEGAVVTSREMTSPSKAMLSVRRHNPNSRKCFNMNGTVVVTSTRMAVVSSGFPGRGSQHLT